MVHINFKLLKTKKKKSSPVIIFICQDEKTKFEEDKTSKPGWCYNWLSSLGVC